MSRRMVCPTSGKVIFWDQKSANRAINRAGKHKVYLMHYKCKRCPYWHLATNRKKKREKPDESLPN